MAEYSNVLPTRYSLVHRQCCSVSSDTPNERCAWSSHSNVETGVVQPRNQNTSVLGGPSSNPSASRTSIDQSRKPYDAKTAAQCLEDLRQMRRWCCQAICKWQCCLLQMSALPAVNSSRSKASIDALDRRVCSQANVKIGSRAYVVLHCGHVNVSSHQAAG